MNQNRLNGLSMLHINKDIALTPKEVLDIFAKNIKENFN